MCPDVHDVCCDCFAQGAVLHCFARKVVRAVVSYIMFSAGTDGMFWYIIFLRVLHDSSVVLVLFASAMRWSPSPPNNFAACFCRTSCWMWSRIPFLSLFFLIDCRCTCQKSMFGLNKGLGKMSKPLFWNKHVWKVGIVS